MVGTEKPLFLLRALPQKKSDFAVLASDDSNLEPVEWHPPGARALAVLIADAVCLKLVGWHPLGARALCAPMTQLFSRNGDGFATF